LAVEPGRFTYHGYDDIHTAVTVRLDDIPPTLSQNGVTFKNTLLILGEELQRLGIGVQVLTRRDDGLSQHETINGLPTSHKINNLNPDIILLAGDVFDEDITTLIEKNTYRSQDPF